MFLRKMCMAVLVMAVAAGLAAMGQVAEVEPNEGPTQATALGTLIGPVTLTGLGTLGYLGDSDWYSFEVKTQTSSVVVSAEGQVSLQVVVYDEEVSYLSAADRETMLVLSPGVYLLRVQGKDLVTGSYSLFVSSALEKESNDGLVEATGMGSVSEAVPVYAYGALDPAGDVDVYSFDVPTGFSKSCVIETTMPSAGDSVPVLVLYAFDTAQERYVPTARSGDVGDRRSGRLYLINPSAGTYYVATQSLGRKDVVERYRISVTAIEGDTREPNNSVAQAGDPIGVVQLSTPVEVRSFITPSDHDFYRFTVAELHPTACRDSACGAQTTSSLELHVIAEAEGVGESAGCTICIYKESGERVACSDGSAISLELEPGEYVVEVSGTDSEALFPYRLAISLRCPLCVIREVEPNDLFETAQVLHVLPVAVEAEIESSDDADYYEFTLTEAAHVTITTSGADDGDSIIAVYDADEEQVAYDDDGGSGTWSRLELDLEAGTYRVAVAAFWLEPGFEYRLEILTE